MIIINRAEIIFALHGIQYERVKQTSSTSIMKRMSTLDSPPWKRKIDATTNNVPAFHNKERNKEKSKDVDKKAARIEIAVNGKHSITEISFFRIVLIKLNAIFGSTKTLSHPQPPLASQKN